MATKFKVRCSSPAGDIANLELTDSLIPFNDRWRGVEGPKVWGDPAEGGAANWAGPDLKLHVSGSLAHELLGFKGSTEAGDRGEGSKVPTGGSFPDGTFSWTCVEKV